MGLTSSRPDDRDLLHSQWPNICRGSHSALHAIFGRSGASPKAPATAVTHQTAIASRPMAMTGLKSTRPMRCMQMPAAQRAYGRLPPAGTALWQMAVGAFIGSAPRAFVYTALGASISDLSSPLAYSAIAVWCVTAVAGAFATHRFYRKWRGRRGSRGGRECEPRP